MIGDNPSLAGSANQSTRDTVQVFSADERQLEPCLLTKARRLVVGGKAQWREKNQSIKLASGRRQVLNESWDWEDRNSAHYGRGDERTRINFPRKEHRWIYPNGKLPETKAEAAALKPLKPLIFHRAGRDGKVGFYSCTWDEFAFLIETFAVEFRVEGDGPEGRWWLVFCPGNFKFLRGSHGRA